MPRHDTVMKPPLTPGAIQPHGPDTSSAQGRIAVLDILRGLALLIMVIAHVADRTGRGDEFGVTVGRWISWFVSTKGMTIFAILFGAGCAMTLGRADAQGRSATGPFLCRLLGVAASAESLRESSGTPSCSNTRSPRSRC